MAQYKILVSIDEKNFFWTIAEKRRIISKNPTREELEKIPKVLELDEKGNWAGNWDCREHQWYEKYRIKYKEEIKKINGIWRKIIKRNPKQKNNEM